MSTTSSLTGTVAGDERDGVAEEGDAGCGCERASYEARRDFELLEGLLDGLRVLLDGGLRLLAQLCK